MIFIALALTAIHSYALETIICTKSIGHFTCQKYNGGGITAFNYSKSQQKSSGLINFHEGDGYISAEVDEFEDEIKLGEIEESKKDDPELPIPYEQWVPTFTFTIESNDQKKE